MSNAAPSARLGLAEFPARAVRDVVAREYRADGRRRGHRAFLDRLRHQARAWRAPSRWPIICTASRPARRHSRKYEDARRTEVLRLQSAARNSLEWFEEVERYLHLDPVQFNYSLLTRSQRISHENLRLRDQRLARRRRGLVPARAPAPPTTRCGAPMFAPFRLRDLRLKNRVVVSPMAQYKAVDGCPTDWHLVHYAERAKGGAGLVFTEMTCVSPEGRITPGCTGMYAPEHEAAWKRIVDFVHAETDAKICCQLGHSGAKGSTQLGWEEMDAPLQAGNWPVMAASPTSPGRRATRRPRHGPRRHGSGARPVRGVGRDGGARRLRHARTALRARLPAVVLHHAADQPAHRRIWRLAGKPHALSAGDLPRGARGVAGGEADLGAHLRQRLGRRRRHRRRATRSRSRRMLQEAGVDICDVSAGQTSIRAQPVYGRMFQTPFSDRIRNETGMATMAVGNIYEPDHVNSILMAGRADLVCLARPHLADPYWTLHAAATLGDRGETWPEPYLRRPRPALSARRAAASRQPRSGLTMTTFAGKHALVTGGGTGIGAAIALALAQAGAAVTICGRRAGALEVAAERHANIHVHDGRRHRRGIDAAALSRRRKRRAADSTSSSPMPARPKARPPRRSSRATVAPDARRQSDRRVPLGAARARRACASTNGDASSSSPRPPG